MCRSEQEDCHECSIRGDPLAAEASLLIPDRPFLTGLEGPIRKCFVSESVPGQAESTTSNLLFGSVQHTSPEVGYQFIDSLGTDQTPYGSPAPSRGFAVASHDVSVAAVEFVLLLSGLDLNVC
jgi:hypothetical protein